MARQKPGRTPKLQAIQVFIAVRAPKAVRDRLRAEFFKQVVLSTIQGREIPGVRLKTIIWTRDRNAYTYGEGWTAGERGGPDPIDALRRAVDVFGLHRIIKGIQV